MRRTIKSFGPTSWRKVYRSYFFSYMFVFALTLRNQGKYSKPSAYSKVEVLLLSWLEPDIETQDEVQRLKAVFEDGFGYHATLEYLDANSQGSLQVDLNVTVASFVKAHNGVNTLLVVYYAGHGKPGESFGDLELFGFATSCVVRGTNQAADIIYNE